MKKSTLFIVVIAAYISAPQAFAADNSFQGFAVGINLEHKATTAKFTNNGSTFEGLGKQSILASIDADYGFNLSSNTMLHIGGKYDLSSAELVKISGTSDAGKIKESGHYSIFAAPGFLANKDTLMYFKLSYENSKLKTTNNFDAENQSINISGVGYGAGVKAALSQNIYAKFEIARINYSTKDIGTVSTGTGSTIGSVGIGYKF